jgi:hypothetical protein
MKPRCLPRIRTPFSASRIRDAVDQASRRGKIPGISLEQGGDNFKITDFGQPFESILAASVRGNQVTSIIQFRSRLKPLMPVIYAIVLLLSIWPGIWLTDSMLRAYFSWYRIPTWWWYLPLTVPTSPWMMWAAVRKSRASGHIAAVDLIGKVAAAVDGEVVTDHECDTDRQLEVQCSA